jgi:hypothetical protein
MSVFERFWHSTRTVGTASPAPNSMATTSLDLNFENQRAEQQSGKWVEASPYPGVRCTILQEGLPMTGRDKKEYGFTPRSNNPRRLVKTMRAISKEFESL